MNVSLYEAAAGMNANARWQDIISQNLMSGSIPGFKKQDLSFAAVQAGLAPASLPQLGSTYVIPRANNATNFMPGEITPTGNDTDFAIDGPGFFEVQMPNGKAAYTRNGTFHLNSQGYLVTSQGFQVIGERGPIRLKPQTTSPFTVEPSGKVRQAGQIVDTIKLVDFNDPQLLTPISASSFEANNPRLVERPAAGAILQRNLENSNTTTQMQMSKLIESMRMFEANQKVMAMQDDRMGRAIADLGSPS